MKHAVCTIAGAIGSTFACLIGGFDDAVITVLIFMLIDWIMGFSLAAFFHNSTKSKTGGLESRAGWRGLVKKCTTILFIIVANRLDMQMNTTFIRDGVCIAFITNELISIVENAGLMGLPIPNVIINAIEVLKNEDGE